MFKNLYQLFLAYLSHKNVFPNYVKIFLVKTISPDIYCTFHNLV
jgi:hypothetical protein